MVFLLFFSVLSTLLSVPIFKCDTFLQLWLIFSSSYYSATIGPALAGIIDDRIGFQWAMAVSLGDSQTSC